MNFSFVLYSLGFYVTNEIKEKTVDAVVNATNLCENVRSTVFCAVTTEENLFS